MSETCGQSTSGANWTGAVGGPQDQILRHYQVALESEREECQRLREENTRLRAAALPQVVPSAAPVHVGADFSGELLTAIGERALGSLDNALARELFRYAAERRLSQVPDDVIAREIMNGGDDDGG